MYKLEKFNFIRVQSLVLQEILALRYMVFNFVQTIAFEILHKIHCKQVSKIPSKVNTTTYTILQINL